MLESVQSRYIKCECLRKTGQYLWHLKQYLLELYQLNNLKNRRSVATVMLLYNLLNNNIDCLDILKVILFLVPRSANIRLKSPFNIDQPKTNVFIQLPI